MEVGWTNVECFQVLSRDGWGGHNGFTQRDYNSTPYRLIVALLTVEYDEDGHFVRRRVKKHGQTKTGRIKDVIRELPPPEVWQKWLTEEDFTYKQGVSRHFTIVWWDVWKQRQSEGKLAPDGQPLTDDKIRQMWYAYLNSDN